MPSSVEPCRAPAAPAAGAVAKRDGSVRWLACSADQAWRDVLGAGDGVVVVSATTEDAARQQRTAAVAYDLSQGTERWHFELGDGQQQVLPARPGGPVVAGGVAVFGWTPAGNTGAGGGTVVALDTATGVRRWDAALSGSGPDAESLVALTETTVVVASIRSLRGLDRATGRERWSAAAGKAGGLAGGLAEPTAAVDGELVVGLSPMGLLAFDAATGETRWRLAGDSSSLPRDLAAASGVVLGVVGNGPTREVRVLDAATGRDRWTKPGDSSYGGLWAIGDGLVVATSPTDGALVAYDLQSGDVRWKREMTRQFYAHPELIDGSIVVALWENQLATLATADGSPVWVLDQPFGTPLMSATATAGDVVVVAVNSKPWQD